MGYGLTQKEDCGIYPPKKQQEIQFHGFKVTGCTKLNTCKHHLHNMIYATDTFVPVLNCTYNL